jgi:nitroimidazol reductase NimA-like FMN-containing flavoprotein (pyridoxamine 5'-phosphate oxidase superfamily)
VLDTLVEACHDNTLDSYTRSVLIHKLTHGECVEALARATIGRLACARDGQPYVVPITLAFDGTASLYSFSMVGQKIEWMRDNPKVCVEVDDISDRFHWTSLLVTGTYEELRDSPDDRDELQRAFQLLQQHSQWWLPGAGRLESGEAHTVPVVYRIRIATVTGRRTARPSQ